MKKLRKVIPLLGILVLLASCSATNRLTMGAVEPAVVSLDPEIKRIGIINRNTAKDRPGALDRIDQILSAEGLNLDRKGAEAAVTALSEALGRDSRFHTVTLIDSLALDQSGPGIFPATLEWALVEELCKRYQVDVLFVQEFYDTDTRADYEMIRKDLPNTVGLKIGVPYHRVRLQTRIKNGWRIYDPHHKAVLDQYSTERFLTSVGEGANPVKAVEAVMGRDLAVKEQSSFMGQDYALRLQPRATRIARNYYVRGSQNLKKGRRLAQTGQWDMAGDLWEQEVRHPKTKIAGRACFNMAVIHEINGKLDEAMDWASRAYTEHGNKQGLQYLKLLQYRQAREDRLKEELAAR